MRMSAQEYREATKPAKPRKYRNQPTVVDGIRFASKKEARRYVYLKALEREEKISYLVRQPRYPLTVNGLHVCTYVADFYYWDPKSGRGVIEDVKGVKTPEFILKAKLFHALYGREVQLV
jgi:hypothetical protein